MAPASARKTRGNQQSAMAAAFGRPAALVLVRRGFAP